MALKDTVKHELGRSGLVVIVALVSAFLTFLGTRSKTEVDREALKLQQQKLLQEQTQAERQDEGRIEEITLQERRSLVEQYQAMITTLREDYQLARQELSDLRLARQQALDEIARQKTMYEQELSEARRELEQLRREFYAASSEAERLKTAASEAGERARLSEARVRELETTNSALLLEKKRVEDELLSTQARLKSLAASGAEAPPQ